MLSVRSGMLKDLFLSFPAPPSDSSRFSRTTEQEVGLHGFAPPAAVVDVTRC